jgi:hypothetical protein
MGKGKHEEQQHTEPVFTLGYAEKTATGDLPLNKVRPQTEQATPDTAQDAHPAQKGEQISEDHAQALERLKARREREPFFYCKIITKWSLKSFRK